MKFKLSHKGVLLQLVSATQAEINKMCELASAKEWSFISKKYKEVTYQRLYQFVMSGLWKRMLTIGKYTGTSVNIEGMFDTPESVGLVNKDLTREELDVWVDSHSFKYTPRWYQFECLYYALKYHFSRCEVATAGGKSFTIFLYCWYLLEKGYVKPGQKILIITIRRMLVTQMRDDLYDYQSTTEEKLIKCDTVFSGGRNFAESNVVIGTYQTLSNYDEEYFKQFAAVIVDECHQGKIASIKDEIFPKMNPEILKHKFGLSGTQPLPGSIDDLHLEAYIGPILFKIDAATLQEEGAIAKIQINMINLIRNWHDSKDFWNAPEMESDKVYEYLPYERKYVQNDQRRCNIIKQIVGKFSGNQVILVENVDYAKNLVALLSEIPDKEVELIWSGTKDSERDRIKTSFKDKNNKVLVATYETMSTGVSINNILALHFPDGGKSRIRIRQSCGRGLRLHPSKEYLTVFDYTDVFRKPSAKFCKEHGINQWPGPHTNRLHSQGLARKKIYIDQKFPIKEIDYELH